MKKTLLLLLVLTLAVLPVLAACDNGTVPPETVGTKPVTQTPPQTAPETKDPDAPVVSGDFSYTLADNLATITGYDGKGGELVIPAQLDGHAVAAIAPLTFSYNDTITSVTLPGTLRETGDLAFFHCAGLTSVTVSGGTYTVSRSCFNACEALASVTLPDSVTEIRELAFQGCTALTDIKLPETLTTIGKRAFAHTGLTSVTVPASVTELSTGVFMRCEKLADVKLENKMTVLPFLTFGYCYSLRELNLPDTITTLDGDSLYRCTALESLTLPTSFRRFGFRCLFGCTALKSVTVLSTELDAFEYYAFRFIPALETINFAGTEETWKAVPRDNFNDLLDKVPVVFNYAG